MIMQRKILYILQILLCFIFLQSIPVQAVTSRNKNNHVCLNTQFNWTRNRFRYCRL